MALNFARTLEVGLINLEFFKYSFLIWEIKSYKRIIIPQSIETLKSLSYIEININNLKDTAIKKAFSIITEDFFNEVFISYLCYDFLVTINRINLSLRVIYAPKC